MSSATAVPMIVPTASAQEAQRAPLPRDGADDSVARVTGAMRCDAIAPRLARRGSGRSAAGARSARFCNATLAFATDP